MPPEILTIINQIGLPGVIIIGMWYVVRHMELRNNEKDKLIYEILREGQNRIEALVNMVLELSKLDAQNRAEMKAAIDMLIEQNQMRYFSVKPDGK